MVKSYTAPAYQFRVGPLSFILNPQYSHVGFCYPRVFVRFPDNSYLNFDLYLSACFPMNEKDWFSWLDGTEEELSSIEDVLDVIQHCGSFMNWQKFEDVVFELYQRYREEK